MLLFTVLYYVVAYASLLSFVLKILLTKYDMMGFNSLYASMLHQVNASSKCLMAIVE